MGLVEPSMGDMPPPTRVFMDMEGRMVEEEARRLGSLQTEVGGATSAISGIGCAKRGRGRGKVGFC